MTVEQAITLVEEYIFHGTAEDGAEVYDQLRRAGYELQLLGSPTRFVLFRSVWAYNVKTENKKVSK